MKTTKYILEKITLLLGIIFVIIPQIIICTILEFRDWLVSSTKMDENEIYARIKRTLIIILVIMVVFSFVAVITLTNRLEDVIKAQNVLIEYK